MDNLFSATFIAPAGVVSREMVKAASDILTASGVVVCEGENLFAGDPSGYLSAPLSCRVKDLEKAWTGNTDCIWCARGGYGAMNVAAAVDWERLRQFSTKMPLIGYSDITALHLTMLRKGLGRPVVAAMASKISPSAAAEVNTIIRNGNINPYPVHAETNSFPSSGMVIAANMAVLSGMCGSNLLPDMHNRILLLEDVNEPVYKLDRYMSQFSLAGILDQVQAIIAGDFYQCGDIMSINNLLESFARKHGKAFATGAPFGHRDAPAAIDLSQEIIFTFT